MTDKHTQAFIDGGRRVRAMLDARDRKLVDEGFTITTTTTKDARGTHVSTEYVSPKAKRIAKLEAQIKAGPPDYVRAGNEYMGQLKCQLIELRKGGE